MCDPQFFFQKLVLVTFVPLWCINLMQKIIKQDKYTLDPGYKNLSKNSNKFSESYILV